jgi:pyruvate dehydrogenase E1 component
MRRPVFHAMQYLMGNQTREKLENFRGLRRRAELSRPDQGHDDVDFSTGSVGLGVAITAFASIMQDYLHAQPGAVLGPRMAGWSR